MIDWLIGATRPLSFRGKARLFGWLAPQSGVRDAVVHGSRLHLDLSDHVQRMIYLGAYEPWETGVLTGYLKPGMSVVDVGANVGYFTLLAARLVGPTGRVIAVEPSEMVADRLAASIAVNGLTQVQLERCGLGRQSGVSMLYDPPTGNHSPSMVGGPRQTGRPVSLRTLDEIVYASNLGTIDLLKVDVEGFEPDVIAGGAGLFASGRVRAVLVELNEYWLRANGCSGEKLYKQLLDYGFEDRSKRHYNSGAALENRFLALPGSAFSA